jgi:hypothetical protein
LKPEVGASAVGLQFAAPSRVGLQGRKETASHQSKEVAWTMVRNCQM